LANHDYLAQNGVEVKRIKREKMRAVVQRVTSASVRVGDEVVGRIGKGLVVLLGVCAGVGCPKM
jgi:uncharacterized protein YqfA (UPF0365 family)